MTRLLSFLCCLIMINAAYANDYWVATNTNGGNDSNAGTSGSPFLTVNRAMVAATSGSTIHVGAGTFQFTGQLVMKAGVNIVGAGASTIFTFPPSMYYHSSTDSGYRFENFLIKIDGNSTSNNLSSFTIDGNSKNAWGGIWVKNSSNIEISNVTFQNLYLTGIWFYGVQSSSLHNSTLKDCARTSEGWASGAIQVANISNMEFHDLTVDEGWTSSVSNFGYGFKAIGIDNTHITISDTKLYDSNFKCRPTSPLSASTNIAVEWHHVKVTDSEVYGNDFYNNVSMVMDTLYQNGPTEFSMHIHDNRFTDNGVEFYALELTYNNVEVDHNAFQGGPNPIALWNNDDMDASNWNIHHNTFKDHSNFMVRLVRALTGLKFENNSIYTTSSSLDAIIWVDGADAELNNAYIRNNIAYTTDNGNVVTNLNGGSISNVTTTHNNLYNFNVGGATTSGSNDFHTDPLFAMGTGSHAAFFALQSTSPCIDHGDSIGYTVPDGLPDQGAYEYDSGSSPSYFDVTLDSDDATLTGTMTLSTDGTALSGHYFSVPSGGTNHSIPPSARASFSFTAPEACSYYIWAHVKTSSGHSGYHLYDGQGHWTTYWDAGVHSSWTWVEVASSGTPITMSFPAGTNELAFGWYQDQAKIDRVVVTNDPAYDPSGSSMMMMRSASMQPYPNPANEMVSIDDESASEQEAIITIRNETSAVQEQRVKMIPGSNRMNINTSTLKNGTYFLHYRRADGTSKMIRMEVRH